MFYLHVDFKAQFHGSRLFLLLYLNDFYLVAIKMRNLVSEQVSEPYLNVYSILFYDLCIWVRYVMLLLVF